MNSRRTLRYVTTSPFKQAELGIIMSMPLANDKPVAECFDIIVASVPLQENLEVDLEKMVQAEVRSAYASLKVPCFVEHAGLVFEKHLRRSYPGGLTKPMWNVLGATFVEETNSAGTRAIARAAVAYCDGERVSSFCGETSGRIATTPRGDREFYWDTIFIPDSPDGTEQSKTYSEIAAEENGLRRKVMEYSQSAKAILAMLNSLLTQERSRLWA